MIMNKDIEIISIQLFFLLLQYSQNHIKRKCIDADSSHSTIHRWFLICYNEMVERVNVGQQFLQYQIDLLDGMMSLSTLIDGLDTLNGSYHNRQRIGFES